MNLKDKIVSAPEKPGVYFFKNNQGEVIYVGKATNLKKRLQSYLHKSSSTESPLKKALLKEIHRVRWEVKQNEIETLLAETHYIKKLNPKYNILMRDDKNYFYLTLTKQDFPHLQITHQPPKNQRTIGPFTSGAACRESLRVLRKIFPYCTCNRTHVAGCTNYYLGLDPGYCCSKEIRDKSEKSMRKLKQQYRANLKKIMAVFSGKKAKIIEKLEKEMEIEADHKNFEKAAKIRDQMMNLEQVLAHKQVISQNLVSNILWEQIGLHSPPKRIEGYDVSNIKGNKATASMVAFVASKEPDLGLEACSFLPKKSQYRKFKIKTTLGAGDPLMIKEALSRRLQHPEWSFPELIIIDGGKSQLNAAKKVKEANKANFYLAAVAKAGNMLYTENQPSQSIDKLAPPLTYLLKRITDQAHRFAVAYHRKLRDDLDYDYDSDYDNDYDYDNYDNND